MSDETRHLHDASCLESVMPDGSPCRYCGGIGCKRCHWAALRLRCGKPSPPYRVGEDHPLAQSYHDLIRED